MKTKTQKHWFEKFYDFMSNFIFGGKRTVLALIILISLNIHGQNCKDLKIGKTYIIYGTKIDSKDPFEKQPKATVTIVNIKKGYIQYCWNKEHKSSNRILFSRSCEDFLWLLKNKKQD